MAKDLKGFGWERPVSLAAFGRGLRKGREVLGMTLDSLAAATGISKPYLSNIETGRAPGPASEEKLRRIAKVLGLDGERVVAGADFLRTPASIRKLLVKMDREGGGGKHKTGNTKHEMGGRGEAGRMPALRGGAGIVGEDGVPRRGDGTIDLDRMMRGGKHETGNAKHEMGEGLGEGLEGGLGEGRGEAGGTPALREVGAAMVLRQVPLINRVAAGKAAEHTDLSYPAGVADAYVQVPDLPEAPVSSAFAVRVLGDSMMPEYREGEIVVVGPGEARDGDDCVVRLGELDGFATTFKRVFFEREGGGGKHETQNTKDETGGRGEAGGMPALRGGDAGGDAEKEEGVELGKGHVTAVRLVPLNKEHAERVVAADRVTGIYPLMYRLVPGRGREG